MYTPFGPSTQKTSAWPGPPHPVGVLESQVVPPDAGLLGLLLAELQLQLPALITLVPQVLAVLAQAGEVSGHSGCHGVQVLVAPGGRSLPRPVEAMAREHVKTVAGQHLAVALLMTCAGVQAGVGRLQALNQ